MNTISYKGHHARVEFDAQDGLFVGRISGIDDVVGFHADTIVGLTAAFREAVEDYVETCARLGKAPGRTFSGRLMLRVSPDIHARAALAAELAGKSLNQWSEEALRNAARLSEEV